MERMAYPSTLSVRHERRGRVVRLTLDRAAVHNALDDALVQGLIAALGDIEADDSVRVVVLEGAGPSFCAGADITSMRASLTLDNAQNRDDAVRLARLFQALDACPVPVVALAHGAVLGAGVGLVAASDHVLATSDARFGLTEARLGILPSVIAPFVLARVGPGATRSLVLTARRFDAAEAHRIGLVHALTPDIEALADAGDAAVEAVLACGPEATRVAKRLLRELRTMDPAAVVGHTADIIARRRVSDEGQEGLRAFLEKRRPAWALED